MLQYILSNYLIIYLSFPPPQEQIKRYCTGGDGSDTDALINNEPGDQQYGSFEQTPPAAADSEQTPPAALDSEQTSPAVDR